MYYIGKELIIKGGIVLFHSKEEYLEKDALTMLLPHPRPMVG